MTQHAPARSGGSSGKARSRWVAPAAGPVSRNQQGRFGVLASDGGSAIAVYRPDPDRTPPARLSSETPTEDGLPSRCDSVFAVCECDQHLTSVALLRETHAGSLPASPAGLPAPRTAAYSAAHGYSWCCGRSSRMSYGGADEHMSPPSPSLSPQGKKADPVSARQFEQ